MARRWRVHLSGHAEKDLLGVVRWTSQRFGAPQARDYRNNILKAVFELKSGPDVPGSRARDDLLPGLRTLHVGRKGRRGRHFLVYRSVQPKTIEIVRILYDGMDLTRHIPDNSDED